MSEKVYLCIDLKSFYASVECVQRHLDPLSTRLVVADPERGDKTICLAVTPALKKLGVKNRCRVFDIPKNIDYIMAEPRMKLYIDYAAEIYGVYLQYIAKEDIHVYSIDEAFMDITSYLKLYKMTAREMAVRIMNDILIKTGIYATCGIGSNLYLAKIALDIQAKHSADFIGYLDEEKYRRELWEYRPLQDFWRIGNGTVERLAKYGIDTMKKIAHTDEELLYKIFGIDAELLIDHAWGRESTTMEDIKNYKPKSNSLSSGQVLMADYSYEDGKIIVQEMAEQLCLDLLERGLVTSSISLYVGYGNHLHSAPAKGTVRLEKATGADKIIIPAVVGLYEQIIDHKKTIRRFNITFNAVKKQLYHQDSLFDSKSLVEEKSLKVQQTVLDIKKKYGKNAVFRGLDLQEKATARERNCQIGGHKSGETTYENASL